MFVLFCQRVLIHQMKQVMSSAGREPDSIFQCPGALTGRRKVQDQASLAPQSTRHCCLEKVLLLGGGVSGTGHRSSLPPSCPWDSKHSLALQTDAFPPISAAPASLSPALRGLCCVGPGCQQTPVGRLQPGPQPAAAPRSALAACGTGTGAAIHPSPSACHHAEKLIKTSLRGDESS